VLGSIATSLDWAIKFSVFQRFTHEQGYDWDAIERWNRFAELVRDLLSGDSATADLTDLSAASRQQRFALNLSRTWLRSCRSKAFL